MICRRQMLKKDRIQRSEVRKMLYTTERQRNLFHSSARELPKYFPGRTPIQSPM